MRFAKSCLHRGFTFGVKRGSRFVQNQDRRIFQECTSDGKPLSLPAREPGSTLPNESVITLRKPFDKVVRQRGFCSSNNASHGDIGLTIRNIVADGVVE